mmetsp:Transcript_20735/g.31878  ORF Transcript_20735/g.31878 Transcript_20735/m.31878 type:complete len:312 (-) Transcript_20735:10389-11324(-)
MLLEESTGNPLVDGHTNHLSEGQYAPLFVFVELLGLLNGLEEEGGERLQRVLVHVVHDAELDQQEVQHGTFGSDAAVHFSQGVNHDLSFLGDLLLLLDFGRGLLSHLEGLDQGFVLQDGGGVGIGQVLEQIRLKLGKSDLELVLLVHELFFFLLEVGLLDLDNHSQELVLKTGLSNNKVDDCALGGSLGLVVRVDELGLEVKLEGGSDLNIFRAESHHEGLALLHELAREKRVKDGVDFLANGFDHEDVTIGHGHFNLLQPILLAQLDGNHFTAFTSLDPLLSLQLGIDNEGISVAAHHNGSILQRDSVGG